ncbi:MAG: NAD(P)-dependent oxidoreductase, partial [Nitrososphaerota archaeon]
MHIAVFGANGPTGRHVTQQALAKGYVVTAFTRHPEVFPIHHERLRVVRGDVYDPEAVEEVVAGQDGVLSSLG